MDEQAATMSAAAGPRAADESVVHSAYSSSDLAPVPPERRNWRARDLAVLWISMAACVPTYMLAASGARPSASNGTCMVSNARLRARSNTSSSLLSESARYMYGHGFGLMFLASLYGEEQDAKRGRNRLPERSIEDCNEARGYANDDHQMQGH